jgi:hypothetical protein
VHHFMPFITVVRMVSRPAPLVSVAMCTVAMQVPVVVQEAKAALAGGHCVVIGLQATGEAAAQVQLLSSNRPLVLAP